MDGYELDHVAQRLTESVHEIRRERFPSITLQSCLGTVTTVVQPFFRW